MRAKLSALLEDGPHTVAELSAWLNEDRLNVARELRSMAEAGLVARVDGAGGVTWRLCAAPAPAPTRRSRGRGRALQVQQPGAVRRTDPAPSASWWLGKDRAEFQRAAADELPRMLASRTFQRSLYGRGPEA